MDNQGNLKQQIAQRLKEANNVLVTVSNNPSVDQLAAAIGLTLLLNKLNKHATAVFSGQVPSTIEFLEPEKTLEKNTDSLRDFIIALDKAKADKLRYKVEDKLVKIFITPYRTSLSEKDLEFSQGDFNVDAVVALGVKQREQLDQAIIAHGRILHDATVISINTNDNVDLGTMNLVDSTASSLSEIVVSLIELMQSGNLLDSQMATAFLTGIVAETDRFRNSKTTPATMSISSKLMASGANQQLIANKLEEGQIPPKNTSNPDRPDGSRSGSTPSKDGDLRIDHPASGRSSPPVTIDDSKEEGDSYLDKIQINENGTLVARGRHEDNPKFVLKPPELGGTLTANSRPEGLDPSTDAMTLPPVNGPLLSHDAENDQDKTKPDTNTNPLFGTSPPLLPKPPQLSVMPAIEQPKEAADGREAIDDNETQTLTDLERFVDSPHLSQQRAKSEASAEVKLMPAGTSDTKSVESSSVDSARNAVDKAIAGSPQAPLEPIEALNANPIDLNSDSGFGNTGPAMPQIHVENYTGIPRYVDNDSDVPPNLMPTSLPTDNTAAPTKPGSPPPVPPPMVPPPFGGNPNAKPDDQKPFAPPVL